MQKKLILDDQLLNITIDRLCQELIESHNNFQESVLIGLQPRGTLLAKRLKEQLTKHGVEPPKLGALDITFHRDDFRRRDEPVKANNTNIPFLIEDKNVIIVDDVLFTGRSVRAALDALTAYGRPRSVELLVLIDRKYTRELPIEPNYIGKSINSQLSQKVIVEWKGDDGTNDNVWLITHNES